MFSRLACLLMTGACVYAAEPDIDPRTHEAEVLIKQGRFPDAARVLRDAYESAGKDGVEDLRLARAAADLGGVYNALDRYPEAESFLNQALGIDRRLFGKEAPQTAKHELILAKIYLSQGKAHAGEELLLHARPIIERAFGPESSSMAALLNHLGLANDMLDRLPQAVAMYRQALAIYEKQGSERRALVAVVLANLVAVQIDLRQYDEAVRTAEKTLAIMQECFGPDHPYVARSLHSLGTAHQALGHRDEAKALYLRALSIWDKNPGVGKVDASAAQTSLAAIYAGEGYYPRAEALLKKALAAREEALGANAPDIVATLNNLGALYAYQRRYTEARKILERGLAIADGAADTMYARSIPVIQNLASVYFYEGGQNKGYYLKSEALFRRLLAIQEKRFGPDHIEIADALSSLTEVCLAEKNYREAKHLEQRALAIRQAVLGPQHPDTVKTFKEYTLLQRKFKD